MPWQGHCDRHRQLRSRCAEHGCATLTRTGSLAVYLHPCDSMHGDLGIVASGDVAVVLSDDGETEETLALLPHFRARTVPIIAIVGNARSTLARSSSAVIDASVGKEADPLDIFSVAHAAVALVIGDALAIALMRRKGVALQQIALNQPAGRRARRLTLKVYDLMHDDGSRYTVSPDASWFEIISTISKCGSGAVNVVDDASYLLGILTDGDLRRAVQNIAPAEIETLCADSIMTKSPIVVSLIASPTKLYS
ncbi:MAG: SIS domain-containing protein [Pyrinomonadaceae bacterium]